MSDTDAAADGDGDDAVSEDAFYPSVRAWLRDEFSPERIEHDVYMENSERFPDFIVELSHEVIAIEVDVTTDRAIKGAGQAHLYTGELDAINYGPTVRPAIAVPKGVVDEPELTYLRSTIPVYPIPHPYPPTTTDS